MRHPWRRLPRATDTRLLRAGRRLSGSPVTQFAATGLLAIVVVGIVGGLFVPPLAPGVRARVVGGIAASLFARPVPRGGALRDPEALPRLAGEGIVAPAVSPGV